MLIALSVICISIFSWSADNLNLVTVFVLQQPTQARSQVLGFGEAKYILRGQDLCLYYVFIKNFLKTTKFGGAQKFVGHCPRMPSVATDLNPHLKSYKLYILKVISYKKL